jgi:hypothetical protein
VMKGSRLDPVSRRPNLCLHTGNHLPGRAPGEGEEQNMPGLYALLDEVGGPGCDCAGFS